MSYRPPKRQRHNSDGEKPIEYEESHSSSSAATWSDRSTQRRNQAFALPGVAAQSGRRAVSSDTGYSEDSASHHSLQAQAQQALMYQQQQRSTTSIAAIEQFLAQQAQHQPTHDTYWLLGYSSSMLEREDLPAFVKEHDANLTFPEKVRRAAACCERFVNQLTFSILQLMLLLMHLEKVEAQGMGKMPMGWAEEGKVIYIRDKDELTKRWLPLFFQQSKASSFTRKLYRWGFRQVSIAGDHPPSSPKLYFCNENFQRDNKTLLSQMRSITAAGRRREQAAAEARKSNGVDSAVEGVSPELSQLLQQDAETAVPEPPAAAQEPVTDSQQQSAPGPPPVSSLQLLLSQLSRQEPASQPVGASPPTVALLLPQLSVTQEQATVAPPIAPPPQPQLLGAGFYNLFHILPGQATTTQQLQPQQRQEPPRPLAHVPTHALLQQLVTTLQQAQQQQQQQQQLTQPAAQPLDFPALVTILAFLLRQVSSSASTSNGQSDQR